MQFCNYARARSIPLTAEAGRVSGRTRGGMPTIRDPVVPFPSPLLAASSRTTREYLNFVSFPRRYSFIRAGAPSRTMINRRIQSPDARNAPARARHPSPCPPQTWTAVTDSGAGRALLICLLDKIRLFFGCRRERCGLSRTSRERARARFPSLSIAEIYCPRSPSLARALSLSLSFSFFLSPFPSFFFFELPPSRSAILFALHVLVTFAPARYRDNKPR